MYNKHLGLGPDRDSTFSPRGIAVGFIVFTLLTAFCVLGLVCGIRASVSLGVGCRCLEVSHRKVGERLLGAAMALPSHSYFSWSQSWTVLTGLHLLQPGVQCSRLSVFAAAVCPTSIASRRAPTALAWVTGESQLGLPCDAEWCCVSWQRAVDRNQARVWMFAAKCHIRQCSTALFGTEFYM